MKGHIVNSASKELHPAALVAYSMGLDGLLNDCFGESPFFNDKLSPFTNFDFSQRFGDIARLGNTRMEINDLLEKIPTTAKQNEYQSADLDSIIQTLKERNNIIVRRFENGTTSSWDVSVSTSDNRSLGDVLAEQETILNKLRHIHTRIQKMKKNTQEPRN